MRRLFLPLALAISLSGFTASAALAEAPEGAQKAPLFEETAAVEDGCTPGGPTGTTSGFAVLNTPGDETTVTGEVSLKRGAPNATYDVIVEQIVAPGVFGCVETFAGTLTTNNNGNGNQHINIGRFPSATMFSVEIEKEGFAEEPEFVSSAVELD